MSAYQNVVTFQMVLFACVITILLAISLYLLFNYRPLSLLNGLLVIPLVFSSVISLILIGMLFHLTIFVNIILIIMVIVIALFSLFTSLLGILLLWNALLVWHREQHSLANSLTLGLGIYIIISPFILNGLKTLLPKGVYIFLIDIEKFTVLYLIGWLICFGLSFLVYRLIKPKYDKYYVIALGAGLLNGNQISPLLKKRVQRGLDFANAQYTATGHYPYMIMSGGQGNDETIPEAQAMAAYAQSVGYPTEYILTEQASKTTFQNMQFSKKLLLQKGLNPNKGIFVTSDYHVFRAGIFAFDNGLKINGLGARTRLYFIYNALIREYIAILARYKKLHVVVLALIILFALTDSLISIWFIK